MTIQSLQKIISLENALYAAEQAEQEKASSWLKEQQEEILHLHEREITALDEKRTVAKARAADEAKGLAAEMMQNARFQSDFLNSLEDAVLRRLLDKTLKFIVGQAP